MDELNQSGKGKTEKEANVSTEEIVLEPAEQKQRNEETEKASDKEIGDDMRWTISDGIKGKLVCPRCGKSFDESERHCPYCGLENNLKLCGTCGATIAKSAKRCPNCGAQEKAASVERKTLLVVAVIMIAVMAILFLAIKRNEGKTSTEIETESQIDVEETYEDVTTPTPTPKPTKKPSTNSNSAGGGRMITVKPEDKPVLGTWEAYCYYDSSNKTTTMVSAAPEDLYFKIVINSDNTGRMYTTYGLDLYHSFEWNFLGTLDEGERVYHTTASDGSDVSFFVVEDGTGFGKNFTGMLAVNYDDLLIFFEKQ